MVSGQMVTRQMAGHTVTRQEDTEITLGTGRMLAIFFGFVLVCAFFFAMGFSLGRKTVMEGGGNLLGSAAGSPAAVVRPSAVKSDARAAAAQSGDFSFYKSVGEKNADAALAPAAANAAAPTAAGANAAVATATADASKGATDAATAAPATGGYFVQVAAVSRKEDADALVEALKKREYPAFSANNNSADKFYHVQVGPYADFKEADAMRARLIGDGYNPIVKK
jgi:DedD protein